MDKEFKTYDELLDILSTRGIDISTPALRSRAKTALQHEGYYNLVNGYKMLFLQRNPDGSFIIPDTYKPGSTIDEMLQLYYFDAKLRSIVLQNILQIETNLKNLISHSFSKVHGHKNYLVYENFDITQSGSAKNITSLIAEIQRQLSGRVTDPSIRHYLTKHGYVPLWVLNNILTLGTISKFYSLMKQPERQEVSKTFHLQDNELSSILTYLSAVRNVCAHGNRLYCFRSTKRPISNLELHTKLEIPLIDRNDGNEFAYGKRDLFAVILIFKILLPKNQFRNTVNRLKKTISNLDKQLSILSIQEVLDCMGFPEDWDKRLRMLY